MDNYSEKNIDTQPILPLNNEEQIDNQPDNQPDDERADQLDSQIVHEPLTEIANLKSQIEILQDKLLRTIAESENTRKRLEKTILETRDYAIFSFAKDLLTVIDNLARALDHKPQNVSAEVGNIITGVEMTKTELVNILKKHGLEPIEPIAGDKFDYNIHHAISQIESNEQPQDSIITVMQLGYKIKDRLLRPAAVQVAKLPEE